MQTLWIKANPDEQIEWVITDEKGAVLAQKACSLEDLSADPQMLNASATYVLIGADYLYTRQVALPANLSFTKAQKVLKYLIEEDVLQPIEEIYCKALKKDKSQLDIAVGDEAKLTALMDKIKTLNIMVDNIYPLAYALPETWMVYQEDQRCHVRTPTRSFSAPAASSWTFLERIYEQALDKPESIAYLSSASTHAAIPTGLPLEKLPSNSLWSVLTPTIGRAQGLDGQLLSEKKQGLVRKLMVANGVIVCLLFVGLTMGFKWNHWVYITEQHGKIKNQISDIYYGLYPNAKALIAPKVRMTQELKKASKPMQDDFFPLMSGFASMVQKVQEIEMNDINFASGRLTVQLIAKDYQPIDKLVKMLETKMDVKQKNTTSSGDKLTATLELTRPRS